MYFATLLLKNLLRRKGRSGLTCIGISVAVATVIALRGVSDNFIRASLDIFEKRGVDIVILAAGVPDQMSSELNEAVEHRLRKVSGVAAVSPGLVELAELKRGQYSISALVVGHRADSFLFRGTRILDGRTFRPDEKRVVLLGAMLADNLRTKIGDELVIQEEAFRVIGIFQSFNVFEDGSVWMPLDALQSLMFREGRVTGFSVILKAPDQHAHSVEQVCEHINNLKGTDGKSLRLSAMPTAQQIASAMHIQLISAMAWLTSVIAIAMAALGLVNSMAMSVVERIHEIGILRAIGWSKIRVMQMILGESLCLSAIGAALGSVAAVGSMRYLTQFPPISGFIAGTIALPILLEGILLALGIGALGGLYPAFRAAKLMPTEALRYE